MNRHEFVTVSLRLLGLVCLMFAVPRVSDQVTAFIETLSWLSWNVGILWDNIEGAHSTYGFSFGEVFVVGVQVAFGLYLVFGGGWLRRRIARMESDRCLECGYDLSGMKEGRRCPECGTGGWSEHRERAGREELR